MVLTLREPVGVVGAVIPWNARWCCSPRRWPRPWRPAAPSSQALGYATFAVLRLAQLIQR
jgi:hypothetical protein